MPLGWPEAARLARVFEPRRFLPGHWRRLRALLARGHVEYSYDSGEYYFVAEPEPGAVASWARRLSRDPLVEAARRGLASGRAGALQAGYAAGHALRLLRGLRVELDSPGAVAVGVDDETGLYFADVLAPQHHWLLARCRPRGKRARHLLGFDLHHGEWTGEPGARIRVQGDLVAWIHEAEAPPERAPLLAWAAEWGARAARQALELAAAARRAARRARNPQEAAWAALEAIASRLPPPASQAIRGLARVEEHQGAAIITLDAEGLAEALSTHTGATRAAALEAARRLAHRDPGWLDHVTPAALAAVAGLEASRLEEPATAGPRIGGARVDYSRLVAAAALLASKPATPRLPPPSRVTVRVGRHTLEYRGWLLDPPLAEALAAPELARGLAATAALARGQGCFWLREASIMLGWRRRARLLAALGPVRVRHPEHGEKRIGARGLTLFTVSTLNTVRF